MKTVYFFIVLILLSTTLKARKGHGKIETLNCIDSKYTYSIILPSTYEKKPNKKFPALFISSPSGCPTTMGLSDWAEENEVMLILNRTTKNGLEDDYSHALKCLMTTIESKYRIHPFLRFSTGVSGGGEVSAHLSVDYPKKWSGVVMQAHSGNGRYPPKHCAVAFLAGEKDAVHGIQYVKKAYEKLKAAGNPVHITIYPDRGHKPGLKEDVIKELTWMLNIKRYNHPAIDNAYIKSLKPELESEIKTIIAISDSNKKREEIKKMIAIPFIPSVNGYKKMLGEYATLQLEYAENESNNLKAWVALIDVVKSDSMKNASRDVQKKLLTKLHKLERIKEVLKEKGAMSKFYKIYKLQQKYMQSRKKSSKEKQKILTAYTELRRKYPYSIASEKAEKAEAEMH